MRPVPRIGACALAALLLSGCVRYPPPPTQGGATLWGYVHLVPREGVVPGAAPEGPYGDRRLRDVRFVDYDHPGFTVVYAEGSPTRTVVALTVEHSPRGARLVPAHAIVGSAGTLRIRNDAREPHTISCPLLGVVRRLPAGAEVGIDIGVEGPLACYVLDSDGEPAVVFAAAGPATMVGPDGRFELRDLTPGSVRIRAWHPRLPGTEHMVALRSGEVTRIDLDLGVANLLRDDNAQPHQ